jgi:hypothetical protein
MASILFNRKYLDYTFNILSSVSALADKNADTCNSKNLILKSFLKENLDADLRGKKYCEIQELVKERTGRLAKKNTDQLFESIETNAKSLTQSLHRYAILKAKYNDDLDPQLRDVASGKSAKNICRQKKIEEKEYLQDVIKLCSKLLKNSQSDYKKAKKILKEAFGLDTPNHFFMSLVLLPLHIPLTLGAAWFSDWKDGDEVDSYSALQWLEDLSWPAWLAVMYGASFIATAFWRGMSGKSKPENSWSKIKGTDCSFCIEPLLKLLSESQKETTYKFANKDGSPDKRRKDNPSKGESVAEFCCTSCDSKIRARLLYTDQEVTKFEFLESCEN